MNKRFVEIVTLSFVGFLGFCTTTFFNVLCFTSGMPVPQIHSDSLYRPDTYAYICWVSTGVLVTMCQIMLYERFVNTKTISSRIHYVAIALFSLVITVMSAETAMNKESIASLKNNSDYKRLESDLVTAKDQLSKAQTQQLELLARKPPYIKTAAQLDPIIKKSKSEIIEIKNEMKNFEPQAATKDSSFESIAKFIGILFFLSDDETESMALIISYIVMIALAYFLDLGTVEACFRAIYGNSRRKKNSDGWLKRVFKERFYRFLNDDLYRDTPVGKQFKYSAVERGSDSAADPSDVKTEPQQYTQVAPVQMDVSGEKKPVEINFKKTKPSEVPELIQKAARITDCKALKTKKYEELVLCISGGKGTGKSAFGNELLKIYGTEHHVVVITPKEQGDVIWAGAVYGENDNLDEIVRVLEALQLERKRRMSQPGNYRPIIVVIDEIPYLTSKIKDFFKNWSWMLTLGRSQGFNVMLLTQGLTADAFGSSGSVDMINGCIDLSIKLFNDIINGVRYASIKDSLGNDLVYNCCELTGSVQHRHLDLIPFKPALYGGTSAPALAPKPEPEPEPAQATGTKIKQPDDRLKIAAILDGFYDAAKNGFAPSRNKLVNDFGMKERQARAFCEVLNEHGIIERNGKRYKIIADRSKAISLLKGEGGTQKIGFV